MPSFSPVDLAEWSGGVWKPAEPTAIEGVSNDSRTIQRGNLYFALTGKNFDGHEFVGEAFDKGASGAVVARGQIAECGMRNAEYKRRGKSEIRQRRTSPKLAPSWRGPKSEINGPLLLVDDPKKALLDIASGYRLKISPEIVAITGSVGKSTVKEMTAKMLSTAMPTARTLGNWNNDIGLPLSILAMEETSSVGVFEVGTNHPGELRQLCTMLRPLWGVVTNVGPVHIEFFDSVDAVAEEKACLLRSLPGDGVAVLCPDGRFFDLFCSLSPSRIITVSATKDADYVCSRRDPVKKEAVIEESSTGDKFIIRTELPGEYNVINAMFAIAVARGHGIEWEQIRAALDGFTPLPMRWEEKNISIRRTDSPGGQDHGVQGRIRVINDAYNANPMSMRAAIQAFDEEMVEGGKWLVLGGMLELGRKEIEEHLALGEFVGKGRWDGLVVVGTLGELIAQGAERIGFRRNRVFRCKNNSKVARVVAQSVRGGDAVLLKASREIHLEEIVEELKEADRDLNNARHKEKSGR